MGTLYYGGNFSINLKLLQNKMFKKRIHPSNMLVCETSIRGYRHNLVMCFRGPAVSLIGFSHKRERVRKRDG